MYKLLYSYIFICLFVYLFVRSSAPNVASAAPKQILNCIEAILCLFRNGGRDRGSRG